MAEEEIKDSQIEVVEANQAHQQEADLAGQFLAKALMHSFMILKIIMGVLVILFITSGIFRVEENENALVLQFGRIREFKSPKTGQMEMALGPGLKWAWPEPISEIVRMPVTDVQTLNINSFWYFQTEQEKLSGSKGYAGQTLNPVRDGYCLTRSDSVTGEGEMDYNIVHAEFQLAYRIRDIEKFFRNIKYKAPGPGEDFLDVVFGSVDPLLKAIASDAVVTTMVDYSIDEAIVNDTGITRDIRRRIEARLQQLDSGIAISNFLVTRIIWPRQVDTEFQQANKASQQSQQAIIDARSYADQTMSEAGGANAEEILVELKKVLAALGDEDFGRDDPQRMEYESQRAYYLSQLAGTSREKIAEARAYRTSVVETARANADYLTAILPEYRKRPELVIKNIYQDTIEQVLANADEKIVIQSGSGTGEPAEFRIKINRDPAISSRQAQEKALEKAQ